MKHGILLVDKLPHMTSHDVVSKVRRVFGTKSVGHAGTLDPGATGLLIVLVGEATKLSDLLMHREKEYETEIVLGAETVSLDAGSEVVKRCEVPVLSIYQVQDAANRFLGTYVQQVPRVSAVKVQGRALHARVRKGEAFEAPSRQVELHEVCVNDVKGDRVHLALQCGKGFYVRSFARDLAAVLGTLGYVGSLRRTRIGGYRLDAAVSVQQILDAASGPVESRESVIERLIPLNKACSALPHVILSSLGCDDAFHGRIIPDTRYQSGPWLTLPEQQVLLLTTDAGDVVALGKREGTALRVVRGIRA